VVLHLAAHIPNRGDPDADTQSRRDTKTATQVLLGACATCDTVKAFVFASSISVYPPDPADGVAHREEDPLGPQQAYGRHKIAGEQAVAEWAQRTGRAATTLRFAGIHGPPRSSGIVYGLSRAALDHTPMTVSEPDTIVAPLFVDDAAAALVAAMRRTPEPGTALICNVGGPKGLRLGDLASIILEETGEDGPVTLGSGAPRRSVMAIDRALEELDWKPRRFQDSLGDALAQWKVSP
jgi:nucleoside-diphosphate-sugar epimerase